MSHTIRRSAVAVGLALVALSSTVGCDVGGDTTATASMISPPRPGVRSTAPADAPGPATAVLASASDQPIRSARIEMRSGPLEVIGSFEGDDADIRLGSANPADTSGSAAVELLLVDGHAYARLGGSVVRVPFGSAALSASIRTRISEAVDTARSALRRSTVDQPGTPTVLDGRPVTRYRAEMTGPDAVAVLEGSGSRPPAIAEDSRAGRITEYLSAHSRVTLTGDLDEDRALRRLEISTSIDTSAFPDCALFAALPATGSIVLDDIDAPQGITAPPADQVKDLTELDPAALLGDLGGRLAGGEVTGPGAGSTSGPSIQEHLRNLQDRLGAAAPATGDRGSTLDGLLEGCPG